MLNSDTDNNKMKRIDTDTTKIITKTKSGMRKTNTGMKKKTVKTGM